MKAVISNYGNISNSIRNERISICESLVLLENRHLWRETLMAILDNFKIMAQEANASLKESNKKNQGYCKIVIDMFYTKIYKPEHNKIKIYTPFLPPE